MKEKALVKWAITQGRKFVRYLRNSWDPFFKFFFTAGGGTVST
jgi:hypothetical protein